MFKKLTVIFLAVCLGIAMVSCAATEKDTDDKTEKTETVKKDDAEKADEEEVEEHPGFEYKFSGTTAVLLSYDGEDEVIDLTQPITHYNKKSDKTKEYDLITVESGAFKNCETVKQIILPDTVEEIGEAAFQNCTALEEVVLPAGLKEIPDQLFYGCSSLTTLEIPETVENIGVFAFGDYFVRIPWYDAQTDTDVIVGDGILLKHNGAAPAVCGENVKKVAYYAFLESEAPTATFTPALETIDALAFYRASTTVRLPNGSTLAKSLKAAGTAVESYAYSGAEEEPAEEEGETEEAEAEETEAETEAEAEEAEAEA